MLNVERFLGLQPSAFHFDAIFADPPYFLSNGGISFHGRVFLLRFFPQPPCRESDRHTPW